MPKPYKTVKSKLDAEKSTWEPKTAAEAGMERRFRGKTKTDRMNKALEWVLEDGMKITEAAKRCGVSRQQLSTRVNAERKRREEAQEFADQARAQRVAEAQGVSPELITNINRRIPESFRAFNDHYFATEHCPDCDTHHETPEFHSEMMDLLDDRSKRLLLFNLPPYHAKSTICTFKSTLYELVRDPESRTAVISAGGDLADDFLYQIKEHLTDESLYEGCPGNLIADWGPFYNPGSWSASEIRILQKSGAQKDPSVWAAGFGKKVYGRRFDRMIFDDCADFENQNTPEAIDKMYRKIWQEYVNRVGKNGRLIFVGTRVAPKDIYYLLADNAEEMGLTVFRRPAVFDEETGATLWSDHLDLEGIRLKSAGMTPDQFQLVYQNIEAAGVASSFSPEVLERAHDSERWLGHHESTWALVMGVDPAGGGAQSGYTAMILMGVDLVTGKRHLIDIVNQRSMQAPQIMEQIYDWVGRYPIRTCVVEVNGLQRQLFQYNEELQRKLTNHGVRLMPHVTGNNKWDPQFGVESMAPLYHQGMISTPWQDVGTRNKFRLLDDQLAVFPAEPTDMVMAMWFAEIGCRDFMKRQKVPNFDPRMRLPARLRGQRKVVNFGTGQARQPTASDFGSDLHGIMSPDQEIELVNVASGVGLHG